MSAAQAARRWSCRRRSRRALRVMRISASDPFGRWRRICASRQTLQEHSGIVSPVCGQMAMLDLSIGTIARKCKRATGGKSCASPPETLGM
jgi:hypothetical protein